MDAGKTLFVVALALFAMELAVRQSIARLSQNSRNLAQAEDRAERIKTNAGVSMLILGNSISGDGIDAGRLSEVMEASGVTLLVEHQPADSSATRDWYLELKNMFLSRRAIPSVLLLPVGHRDSLTRFGPDTEDTLYTIARLGDLPLLNEHGGGGTVDDLLAMAMAHLSASYGFRGRLQKRLFSKLVPGYVKLQRFIRSRGRGWGASGSTFWVQKIAELAEGYGIRVIVVVVPTLALRDGLPSDQTELAGQFGWPVLSPGAQSHWAQEDVPDGLHLTAPARGRFTDLLARDLAIELRRH